MRNIATIVFLICGSFAYTTPIDSAFIEKKLAMSASATGDYYMALEHYFRALDLFRECNDVVNADKITNNIGNTYSRAGFHSTALVFYHDVFEKRKSLGDSLGLAKVYYNIARSYRLMGEYEESRKYIHLSRSIFNKLLDTTYVSWLLNDEAITYRMEGEYAKAMKLYQQSVRDSTSGRLGMLYSNIGYCMAMSGDSARAAHYYNEALHHIDEMSPANKVLLFQNYAQINSDSSVLYYERSLASGAVFITKEYLEAANALYTHYDTLVNSEGEANHYYSLVFEGGLKLVQQRDEFERQFDLYQVKTAHYKRQMEQQATLLHEKQVKNGIAFSIALVLLTLSTWAYYKREAIFSNKVNGKNYNP